MANATKEMAKTEEPGFFDLVIVNDNLEKAYEEMKTFILP
jgi:guanylate kinase